MNPYKIFYRFNDDKGDTYQILFYFNRDNEEFTYPVLKYRWPAIIDVGFFERPSKPTPVYPCEKDDEKRLFDQQYIDITYMQGSVPPKLREWVAKILDKHYAKLNKVK